MDSYPCPQCGSTNLTTEEDGLTYCANGHQQDVGTQLEAEQEFGTRPGQILRKKEDKPKQKVSKIYRGKKGYMLFLQAWQFVLWKQCWMLIHVCGMNADLWGVVKGLWALRLTKLRRRFDDGDEDGDGGDDEMGLMSTESETDTEDESEVKDNLKMVKKASDNPVLMDVAALNYLGLLIMRSPVRLATFFDWLSDETIPYVRAIRFVPKEIKEHLASEYHLALDTTSILRPMDLQLAVYRTAVMYSSTFGITITPSNHLLLLQDYIESLALPLQVYDTAKKLNAITNFDFSYPSTHRTRRSPTSYPEAQLMSLVVMATKLVFPFDSGTEKRFPYDLNEVGAVKLDWNTWLQAKETFQEDIESSRISKLAPGKQLGIRDIDVLEMDDKQLDEYMAWYQRTWVNHDRKEEGIQKEILDMFPLEKLGEPQLDEIKAAFEACEDALEKLRDERLKTVISTMKTRRPVSEEEAANFEAETNKSIKRPGQGYQQFKKMDELASIARAFYYEAATVACLDLDLLVRAVRVAEERIDKSRLEQRRQEIFGRDVAMEENSVMGEAAANTPVEDEEMYL